MANNEWNIDGNNCNPWKVTNPKSGNKQGDLIWALQATAPLPFEAISDLEAEALGTTNSPLLPSVRPGRGVVSVTKDFFQSSPNGISSDSVKADVLGFFGVVISYAKGATDISDNPTYGTSSPKITTSIMPRTEFVTLYAQVKSTLPGSGTLYDLVKILACYTNQEDGVEYVRNELYLENVTDMLPSLDKRFCDGTVEDPKPNSVLDKYGWCLKNTDSGDKDCLKVQDWITSITGDSPDKLTTLDKLIDGSIGGLGTALENVIGTTRAVPLFEFRNLNGIKAGAFESNVDNIEKAIIAFHDKYKSAPSARKLKRDPYNKRQAPTGCAITAPPAPTSSLHCSLQNEDPDQGITARGCVCGSATLPLLTITSVTEETQSCAYTTLPLSAPNPISIETVTYTSNCKACTLVGGIADTPTCTAVKGCTTSTTNPPATPKPSPVCKPGFYGTDTSCDGTCNGPGAKCECVPAGYLVQLPACTCTC